jgi:hypothetical protein
MSDVWCHGVQHFVMAAGPVFWSMPPSWLSSVNVLGQWGGEFCSAEPETAITYSLFSAALLT